MTSAYDNWLAAPYTDGDDRALAEERESERIAGDSDKVRELVEDNLDAIDSPVCSDTWPVEVLIALRELSTFFGSITQDAIRTPDEAHHFRKLLDCAKAADNWIAKLIDEAASEAVDEAANAAAEARAESWLDARDYL